MNSLRSRSNSFWIKVFIVLFYIGFIGIFLFLPRIKEYFIRDCSLNIYTFAGIFAVDVIEKFEQTHGVKVSVKLFDSNEELFAKFKINRGEGYDLITPSDYMVELLVKDELLAKLDHRKLPIFEKIDRRLLGFYFDPYNDYSIPFGWTPYGLLFNKRIFKQPPKQLGLELLFKHPEDLSDKINTPYRISMKDDYREAVLLASLYLFNSPDVSSAEKLAKIKDLLIKQKGWVENYLDQDIGYFFMSDIVHLAISNSNYAKKVMEESDDFDFIIPKEGSFLSLENLAIPKQSTKVDLAYKFINFVLSEESSKINASVFGLNPANADVYEHVDKRFLENPNFFPSEENFYKLHLIHNNLPLNQLERIWLEVKGA